MLLDTLINRKSNPNDPDVLARKMGFPSAAAMQAFHQREVQRITSNSQAGDASSLPGTASGAVNQGLSIHPAHLLQYVLDKWNEAMGNK